MNIVDRFKHLFIPHEGNDFKPHFFREASVAIILFVSIFLLGASFGSSLFLKKTVLGASLATGVLIDLANESRMQDTKAPLTHSTALDRAAQLKGEDMAKEGYFSHNSPEGVTPWHWFHEVGYVFLYAGENLAINFTDSSDVNSAWLKSPTHRANIMNENFREIGIATIDGYYKNIPTIYVVQMFGTPARASTKTKISNTQDKATSTALLNQKSQDSSTSSPTKKVNTLSIASTTAYSTSSVLGATIQVGSSTLVPLITTSQFASVKNISDVKEAPRILKPIDMFSTWYSRFIFWFSSYVGIVYKILLCIITVSLLTMILIEIKKQHTRHIMYGLILLIVITVFSVINRGFFP